MMPDDKNGRKAECNAIMSSQNPKTPVDLTGAHRPMDYNQGLPTVRLTVFCQLFNLFYCHAAPSKTLLISCMTC